MALINYVDKAGLRFFYQQIKALISKSDLRVIDITSETAIPKRETSGVSVYHVNGSTTTIQRGENCNQIPVDAPDTSIFIMDNCYLDEATGKYVNMYLMFAESALFTGSIETSNGVDTVGVWGAASSSECIVELTQSEYDDLVTAGQVDPDIAYFISDGTPGPGEGGGSPDSAGIEVTQEEYDNLPEADKLSDKVYFVTDGNNLASEVIVGLTPEAYAAIPDEVKNNDGKMYMISDGPTDVILMSDIIDSMTHKGELQSTSNLPVANMHNGDFYYIKDLHEGRYWNGSAWKIVR